VSLFIVYDGHGGSNVVDNVVKNMPAIFKEMYKKYKENIEVVF
jgi:serine/threonine protein phosphatase PrpC